MSIKLRFAFTLGFLLLGLTATLLLLRIMEQQARRQAEATQRSERRDLLDYWLKADAGTFIRTARHLAEAAETSALLEASATGTKAGPESVSLAKDYAIWLLQINGKVAYRSDNPRIPSHTLPLQGDDFTARVLQLSGCHFYFSNGEVLFEVCSEPIRTSADLPPSGWLLLIRPWDQGILDQLGSLSGSRLSLSLLKTNGGPAGQSDHLRHNLRDWAQQPVAQLIADFPPSPDQSLQTGLTSPLPWFILFGLLVIAAVGLGLRCWVLTPLDRISASLANGSSAPLKSLKKTRNELGDVARLVESSFAQRDALKQSESNLQQALDERIRLGRDLHDGVIQALYATGMGLAGIKARLNHDQADVATGLEQSRAALNETILDLRNFITGLEPEVLKEQTFGQAVAFLLENARNTHTVDTTCEIDEDLATKLTISQRANILQITREALSNALRHGEATEIAVRFQAIGAVAEFEIQDNGRGFDPTIENGNGGHGLENLAGRARDIGATFNLQSHPGAGTRLQLTFKPRTENIV